MENWWQIGKYGRTLFDMPKPTVGYSANGRSCGRFGRWWCSCLQAQAVPRRVELNIYQLPKFRELSVVYFNIDAAYLTSFPDISLYAFLSWSFILMSEAQRSAYARRQTGDMKQVTY